MLIQVLPLQHQYTAKTTTATASTATSAPAVTWTLDSLNNAEWYENIGKGQLPVYARAHVMLNNAHASPVLSMA